MTAPAPELGEPRWHPDPEGGPGLRWWDGTSWTAAVMGPAELGPAVQRPLPAGTPVYTWSIWAIALLPLLATAGLLVLPMPSLSGIFDASADPLPSSADLNGLLRNLLSLTIYAASVALALHDRRALLRAGYVRPFHWAWAFLYAGVYVVGRSIIVQRRIGRGLTPIWVWAGVSVLGLIVAVGALAQVFTALLQSVAQG
jgi:hypothetical protein